MVLKALWDSATTTGRNRIRDWSEKEALSVRDRAALNHRFHMLEQMDYALAIGTKVLNGPLRGTKGIYKVKAFGDRALRPMLCQGPVDHMGEYTILQGAIEVEMGRLRPLDAEARAMKVRQQLVVSPITLRLPHEHF